MMRNRILYQPPEHQQQMLEPSPETRLKLIDFLQKLQVGDLSFLTVIERGLALFGITKAGKTTFAHHLLNNQLIGTENAEHQVIYRCLEPGVMAEGRIGEGHESETVVPNHCRRYVRLKGEREDIEVLDCPGFNDSKGCLMLIANAYFHYRVLSKVRQLKFVLTFDYQKFSGICEEATNTMKDFLNAFNPQLLEDIIPATAFVFTRTPANREEDWVLNGIVDKLREIVNRDRNKRHPRVIVSMISMIESILQGNKIFLFKQAEVNRRAVSEDLLQRISDCTSFWTREVRENGTVDMRGVRPTLGKAVRGLCENDSDFEELFGVVTCFVKKRFKDAFLRVEGSVKAILQDLLQIDSIEGDNEALTCDSHVRPMLEEFGIYNWGQEGSQLARKRQLVLEKLTAGGTGLERRKIVRLQLLELAKKVLELTQRHSQSNDYSVEYFQKVAGQVLGVVGQLGRVRVQGQPQRAQRLNRLVYLIGRLIEEAAIFIIIFRQEGEQQLRNHFADLTHIPNDCMMDLNDRMPQLTLTQLQLQSLNTMQVLPDMGLEYYAELEGYLSELEQVHDDFRAKRVEVTQLKLQSGRAQEQMLQNGKVHAQLHLVRHYEDQLDHQQSGQQKHDQYLRAVMDLAGTLSRVGDSAVSDRVKGLQYAILLYSSSNDPHQTLKTYKALVELQEAKKLYSDAYQSLLDAADYALTHGRLEQGCALQQQAYSMIPLAFTEEREGMSAGEVRQAERKALARAIGMQGVEAGCHHPSAPYFEEMLGERLYESLPEGLLDSIAENFPQ